MFKNIDFSDPTIIGAVIGIVASILGAIVGAILTEILNILHNRGRIHFLVLNNQFEYDVGDDRFGDKMLVEKPNDNEKANSSIISFKLLVANSFNKKYSLSNIRLIIKSKINKHSFVLYDLDKNISPIQNLLKYPKLENYYIESNLNETLSLRVVDKLMFKEDYKKCKFFLEYIDNNNKKKTTKLKFKFGN